MKEVKTPKKPLIFYYAVAMLAVFLFNFFAMPWLAQHQIKEVDYNTFVEMVEQDKVGKVEIQEQDNRILFTDKDETVIYKTAMVSDDDLSARLLEAGVSFKGEEIEQTSLLVDILGWVLPILIFIALGQYMSKKMADKLGGNSMMFGLGGNSNVKVYVQSTEGIHFSDVAGEDEAKENLQEVVNDLHERRQSPANADAGGYHRVGRVQGHAHAEAHAHPMLRRDRLVHGVGPQQGVDGPVCAAGVADVAERPRPTLRVVVELTAEPGQLVEIEQITGPRVISPYGFEILRVGIERYAEIKERGTVGDIAGPQPVQAVVEILAAGVALRARPPYLRSHAGELQARGGRGDETVLEVLRLLF